MKRLRRSEKHSRAATQRKPFARFYDKKYFINFFRTKNETKKKIGKSRSRHDDDDDDHGGKRRYGHWCRVIRGVHERRSCVRCGAGPCVAVPAAAAATCASGPRACARLSRPPPPPPNPVPVAASTCAAAVFPPRPSPTHLPYPSPRQASLASDADDGRPPNVCRSTARPVRVKRGVARARNRLVATKNRRRLSIYPPPQLATYSSTRLPCDDTVLSC